MSGFPDQDKSYWHSICLRSLWYFAAKVDFHSQYCCEIHSEINLLEMHSFPTLLVRTQFNVIQPSTLKYSSLHRLNCFVRAGVLFDYLSPCPVHIPSKSLFLSSHLSIIRSLHFSLSLHLVPSGPSLSEPWSQSLQPTFFSHSQRKDFTLLSGRNYFWRILSCGLWRPVVMQVVPQETIRITTEHHIPKDLNLQEYHLENLKYPKIFFYCNTKHSRCCDVMWSITHVCLILDEIMKNMSSSK